jgi:hypothetical protein
MKYKILLPTNGYEVGSEVELTEEQANNFNAGEPTPRVELVAEAAPEAVVPPTTEGEPTPPANDEDQTPPNNEGNDDGSGAEAKTDEGEGGSEAGEQNA